MKNTYNITIIINLFGEDTPSIKKLTINSAESSILHCIGKYLEKASPTGHISSSKVYRAIQCLKYTPCNCNSLFNLNPRQFTKTTAEIILKDYENSLLRSNSLSLKTKHALSQTFRNILTKIPQFSLLSTEVQQAITQYKTILPRLPRRALPEGILSELELDAIDHESPFDLLIRSKAITSDRKMQLIGDCEQEISEYLSLREALKTAADSHNRVITESTDSNQIKCSEIIEFMHSLKIASIEERGKIMEYAYFNSRYRKKFNDTAHPLFKRYLLGRADCRPWIFSPYRLPNQVLFSIFLLLLIKTGWNVGSLGKMKSTDINRRNNQCWTIQGYKSKTDDQTPEYEVEDADKLVRTALDLLDWNREGLINLKIIPEKNTCLWHGWSYFNSKRTIINLDSARKKASARMSIGKTKLKDIRNLIAVDTYLTTNNIDDVRLILGHSDVEDSAHYISIELIDRLDSALMLEFTRRLEATAIFQNFGMEGIARRNVDHKKISSDLLVTTGIGTKCSDPSSYPLMQRLQPCDGLHCLSGGECPNHRYFIDMNGIITAIATVQSYREYWEDMYDQNNEKFLHIDLPRIIFVAALLRFVSSNRPDLYKIAQKRFGAAQ